MSLLRVAYYHNYNPLLIVALSIKIAPKPDMTGSLGPKASKYESLEGKYGLGP